jgi:hypothetical protein
LNESGEVVGTQVTQSLPAIIAPTREGTFYAAPPAGLGVVHATATLGGIPKSDDDDISIDLLSLMDLITTYKRPGEDLVGVSNVAELYDALVNNEQPLSSLSASLAEISKAQVDDVFVSHGFFADLDGDRAYNADVDGEIGASSHPVTLIGDNTYPASLSRRDPGAYEGSFVTINTGDTNVNAIIQISMPADGGSGSYAYVAPRNGSSQVELAVPGADQNAEVTIITAGKGYKPVIAFRVKADDFHEQISDGSIHDLRVATVELQAGEAILAPSKNSATIQFGIMIGGIVAVMLVIASLVAIRRQWGKA